VTLPSAVCTLLASFFAALDACVCEPPFRGFRHYSTSNRERSTAIQRGSTEAAQPRGEHPASSERISIFSHDSQSPTKKPLTKRCRWIIICISIPNPVYRILYTGSSAQDCYRLEPWALFGRVPIGDYVAPNRSRSNRNTGIAAATTLLITADL
jgi:hypothetical protein